MDEVAGRLGHLLARYPRRLVIDEIRRAVEDARLAIRSGHADASEGIEQRVAAGLEALTKPSIRRVINATGVVLHTNLGRAPLPPLSDSAGYSNLEYDLDTGRRGKRDTHAGVLLERLLGAPGIVVNNNAAAIYLALNELAAGGEVVVSRGELIEIGDGFRIPDIMVRAGVTLREIGTTNRTRIEDYRAAITDRTRLILIVHPSNFRIQGFTAKPERAQIAALGRERGVPVYEDLGSGCLVDLRDFGIEEPLAQDCIRDGVSLVSFSGDKLLGGAQAGILAGEPGLVARLRRNPMYRALRVDKLTCQILETTLRHTLLEQWDSIPALRMIMEPVERIRARAESLLARMNVIQAELIVGESVIGGGSTPEQSIPTWLITVTIADLAACENRLRHAGVIARIADGRLVLDLRTVLPDEQDELARRLDEAVGQR